MKKYIYLYISVLTLFFSACKVDSTVVETTPNYCLPYQMKIEGNDFLQLKYNDTKLVSTGITLEEDEIVTTYKYGTDGKIASATTQGSDGELVQTFKYDSGKITKVEIKDGGEIIGEKVISYQGNYMSKIEEFSMEEGKKILTQTFIFTFDGSGNVKKITLKIPELFDKEFTFFEGTTYGSKLSEFAALAQYNQVIFISHSELFIFFPSFTVSNILSKNACEAGKFNLSVFAIILKALFNDLTEAEILKELSTFDFKNTIQANEKGFVNSNIINFKTDKENKLNFSTNFECNK